MNQLKTDQTCFPPLPWPSQCQFRISLMKLLTDRLTRWLCVCPALIALCGDCVIMWWIDFCMWLWSPVALTGCLSSQWSHSSPLLYHPDCSGFVISWCFWWWRWFCGERILWLCGKDEVEWWFKAPRIIGWLNPVAIFQDQRAANLFIKFITFWTWETFMTIYIYLMFTNML